MLLLILLIPSVISFSAIDQRHTNTYINMIKLLELNNLRPDASTVSVIYNAAKTYDVDAVDMLAIAIVESRLNASAINYNSNGTKDVGLFQINTVNHAYCKDLRLALFKDNALCAARLLARHKLRHTDYVGVYHSKTPKYKQAYLSRIATVKRKNKQLLIGQL